MNGLEEVVFVLHDCYNEVERRFLKSMLSEGKHGKTVSQKQKAVAKRHKKNKNKKTHRK